jgi:hypothetical protein
MLDLVHEIGRYIDISTLDGITIAVDYDAALRELDRGIEGLRLEERTNDEGLVGVGKAVVVKRGEEIKTHIVLLANPVCVLAFAEDERDAAEFRIALAIVAHECAHVGENASREGQFPGILLDQTPAGYIRLLERQFSQAFWCEYAVCRISAPFARSEEKRFRDNLASRLKGARTQAREAIRSYRAHGDVERVLQEVGASVLEPLRMASYLFGHLDGVAEEETDIDSELVGVDPAFVVAIRNLVSQMRLLWHRRGEWKSHDDMLVLGRTAFDLLRVCGVHATPQPDGRAYINVPFIADTI